MTAAVSTNQEGLYGDRSAHIPLYTLAVYNLVNLIGGNARAYRCGGNVENFPGQSAHLSHRILTLCIQQLDFVGPDE